MNTDELTRIVEITNKYVRENKNIVFMLDIAYYNYGINHDLSFVKKICIYKISVCKKIYSCYNSYIR